MKLCTVIKTGAHGGYEQQDNDVEHPETRDRWVTRTRWRRGEPRPLKSPLPKRELWTGPAHLKPASCAVDLALK